MDERIVLLIRKLKKNLRREWTVATMTAVIDVSAPHLHRLFKTELSCSPIQYLRYLRMKAARRLLLVSPANIKEIRIRVGITDRSNFTHDFKRQYGITPTALRQERKPKTRLKIKLKVTAETNISRK